MNRRAYWLSILFAALSSFSYLLWCWHDETLAEWNRGAAPNVMRKQTKADHAASIGYALARVVLVMGLLELIPKEDSRK